MEIEDDKSADNRAEAAEADPLADLRAAAQSWVDSWQHTKQGPSKGGRRDQHAYGQVEQDQLTLGPERECYEALITEFKKVLRVELLANGVAVARHRLWQMASDIMVIARSTNIDDVIPMLKDDVLMDLLVESTPGAPTAVDATIDETQDRVEGTDV